jgi:hypothetical protein
MFKPDPAESDAVAAAVVVAQARAASIAQSQATDHARISPAYPGYARPTPTECHELKAELEALHGPREQPPPPESPPELLDSLVRE